MGTAVDAAGTVPYDPRHETPPLKATAPTRILQVDRALRWSLSPLVLAASLVVMPSPALPARQGHVASRVTRRHRVLATLLSIGSVVAAGHFQPTAEASGNRAPHAGEVQICGSELRLALPHGQRVRLPWAGDLTMRYSDGSSVFGSTTEVVEPRHYEGDVAVFSLELFDRFMRQAWKKGLRIKVRVRAQLPKSLRRLEVGSAGEVSREFWLPTRAGRARAGDSACHDPAKDLVRRRTDAEQEAQVLHLLPRVAVGAVSELPPVLDGGWDGSWVLPLEFQAGDTIRMPNALTDGPIAQAVAARMEAVLRGGWMATPNEDEWIKDVRVTFATTVSPGMSVQHAEPCSFIVPVVRSGSARRADSTEESPANGGGSNVEQSVALRVGLQTLIGKDDRALIEQSPDGSGYTIRAGYCDEDAE